MTNLDPAIIAAALNELDWNPMEDGMFALLSPDEDIAAVEKLFTIDLAMNPAIVETPGGYEIAFYMKDCSRLAEYGVRFPALGEFGYVPYALCLFNARPVFQGVGV